MSNIEMKKSDTPIQTQSEQTVNRDDQVPPLNPDSTADDLQVSAEIQRYSAKGYLWAVGILLLLLVGGFGSWSLLTEIHGAVIAPGEFRSINNRQLVQHAGGGTVSEIYVRNGDVVTKGEALMALDSTDLKIERSVHINRLLQTDAIITRLQAEREGIGMEEATVNPIFGKEITRAKTINPSLYNDIVDNPYITAQLKLFESRQAIFQAQLDQFDARSQAKRDQLVAIGRQISAKRRQGQIIRKEFNEIKKLVSSGHIEKSRVVDAESNTVRLASELAQMEALLAVTKGESAGLEQEKLVLISERQETVIEQLREQELSRIELADTLKLNTKELERTFINAPHNGIVTALTIHTEGGVISPGAVLMTLAPVNENLVIEARVTPDMVDEVYRGQEAKVFLSSLNESNNPELSGKVLNVSADRLNSEDGVESFYHVEVQLTEDGLSELKALGVDLVSGMPVEVHLQTGARSPLSYLTKPLFKQINRALRES